MKLKEKKHMLQRLQNKFGGNCNIEIAYAWKRGKSQFWDKKGWVCFKDCKDEEYIEKANNRTIGHNEIVLDIDRKTLEEAKKDFDLLIKNLDKEHFSYEAYFTGSKGFHVHLVFEELENYEKERLREIKQFFINKYKCDLQKATNRCMIALENTPHWKTGKKKKLMVSRPGTNQLTGILMEMPRPKRTIQTYQNNNNKFTAQIKKDIKVVSNENGINYVKICFNKDTQETFEVFEKLIHTWHIEEINKLKSKYFDYDIFMIKVSNTKSIREFKGSVEDISKEMKRLPGCADNRNLTDSLNALIGCSQIKNNSINEIENPLVNCFGYCMINNTITEIDIEKNTKLNSENVDAKKLNKAILLLNQMINDYSKSKEHKEDMLRIISLGLLKPFGYCRKQNGSMAPITIIKGESGTGKTMSTLFIGACLGYLNKRSIFEQSGSSISGAYQFARNMSLTTFPLMCNEANVILQNFSKDSELSELHKNLIETPGLLREKMTGAFVGYRTPIYTCNYELKISNHALRCKVIVFHFGLDLSQSLSKRQEMARKIVIDENEFSYIGSWILKQIKEKNKLYQEAILTKDYSEASLKLMSLLYADAKIKNDLPKPKEIGYIDNNESNNSSFIDDMIDFLKKEIISRARSVGGKIQFEKGLDIERALDLLIKNSNMPSWMIYQNKLNNIMITHSIVSDLMNFTKQSYEINAFEKACIDHNIEYKKNKKLKINKKTTTKSGLYTNKQEFLRLFTNVME